jgi:lipopolysaccharide transport system ATP-binding protein
MISHRNVAIKLIHVSKEYPLNLNRSHAFAQIFLPRFAISKYFQNQKKYQVIKDMNLEIKSGTRLALIGRNGAGKTTLLKLILGVTKPTKGSIVVNGECQALMSTGVGFSAELTGEQNVRAALSLKISSKSELELTVNEVRDFCELGDFWDQPLRTYSQGMEARLMFATATSIHPSVLIVDEILGAGDAYFIQKSRERIQKLIHKNLTLILVTHSMQQILEFCTEAIWLEDGKIRMRSDTLSVVKAYEKQVNSESNIRRLKKGDNGFDLVNDKEIIKKVGPNFDAWEFKKTGEVGLIHKIMQEPQFTPNQNLWSVDRKNLDPQFNSISSGGLSRWGKGTLGLEIVGFQVESLTGVVDKIEILSPVLLRISLKVNLPMNSPIKIGIVFHDSFGKIATKIISPNFSKDFKIDDLYDVCAILDPIQLGAGEYTIGISVLHTDDNEKHISNTTIDIVSRSFKLIILNTSDDKFIETGFIHSAEWIF